MAKANAEGKEKEKEGGKKEKIYDVAILGAGPAGLTAAIYCNRYGLSTIVISKDIGGVANYADIIENYPGFEGKGIELMQKFAEQAKKQGAEIVFSELVGVKRAGKYFMIATKNKEIKSKAIIITLGTEHKRLGIPGEAKFIGRGVSFCTLLFCLLCKSLHQLNALSFKSRIVFNNVCIICHPSNIFRYYYCLQTVSYRVYCRCQASRPCSEDCNIINLLFFLCFFFFFCHSKLRKMSY